MSWLENRKTLFISGALFLLSQGSLVWILHGVCSGPEFMAQQTTLSPEQFQQTMQLWGPQKIELVFAHYWIDFFHPVIYAVLMTAGLFQLTDMAHSPAFFRRIVAFPVFAAAFDEIENIVQLALYKGWLGFDSPLFYLGGVSALLKWLLIFVSGAALWIGLVRKFLLPARP